MTVLDVVRIVFENSDADVVHECRRCGTNVDDRTATCPCCGSTSIARYEIS